MSDDDLIARLEAAGEEHRLACVFGRQHDGSGRCVHCAPLLNLLREAAAALRAAERGAEGWEPIETAPLRGRVLVGRSQGEARVVEMAEQPVSARWTHWRPLPPPPASSSGESEG